MKKRIVCVLLTLIMLLSLVPMGASAATRSTSEAAITVLKQMTKFVGTCYHFTGSEFRTGYGTVCEEKHHFKIDGTPNNSLLTDAGKIKNEHSITQANADLALRAALKELDKKINSFASSNGLNLTQNQHDALVVFTYDVGAAWMSGTGVLKSVIVKGGDVNELLNAMSLWGNMNRRKVEANMYVNGIYSNTIPSSYSAVTYNANGGTMAQNSGTNADGHQIYVMQFDSSASMDHVPAPTRNRYTFKGWYYKESDGTYRWVPSLNSSYAGKELVAMWQYRALASYTNNLADEVNDGVSYDVYRSQLVSDNIYSIPEAKKEYKLDVVVKDDSVKIDREFIDPAGVRWCRLAGKDQWVRLGTRSASTSDGTEVKFQVTVTVTNSYVNRRVNANAGSAKNGSYNQGEKLLIIAEKNGWGQVGKTQGDGSIKAVGWVYLIYTNWGSVQDEAAASSNNTNAIATAVITYNGYLNIRQEPGTDGKITGALAKNDTVKIYEIKTVNGHQWGRCDSGWVCLTYARVVMKNESAVSNEGVLAYAFTGVVLNDDTKVYVEAGENTKYAQYADEKGYPQNLRIPAGKAITITNLKVINNTETWAKVTWKNDELRYTNKEQTETEKVQISRSGWIKLMNMATNESFTKLDPVKYTVVSDSVNVRNSWGDAANMIFTLNKGVEVDVIEVALVGENIWGRIVVKQVDHVGTEEAKEGYVNLASKYFSRGNAPAVEEDTHSTNKIATVINTDTLKVRATGALYGNVIGSLARNTTVPVWESNKDGWYKVDSNQNGQYDYKGDGWAYGEYLDIRTGTVGGNSTVTDAAGNKYETDGTGKGIVANTYAGVNVRTGPSTGYASNGKLLPGTVVEILETANAGKWGRTAQGWICMDYVTMVSYNEVVNTPTTNGTTVESYEKAEKTTTTAIYTGALNTGVTIYRTPEEKESEVLRVTGSIENVTMHELAKVTKVVESDPEENVDKTTTTTITTVTYWARINDGWVKDPQMCLALTALDEKVHTQTGVEKLNVRREPDESADNVFDVLVQGDQVKVTRLQIVKDKVWGRIETNEGTGWIRLDYMSEGEIYVKAPVVNNTPTTPSAPVLGNGSSAGGYVTNTSGYRYTGKIIRENQVNVRANPSTTAAITTTLKNGAALVVYETTIAENMAWGRCDAGWVYLYYVDLTPVVNGAVDARVVYNDNTIIYSDVNGSAVAGTYARMSTVDIYEIVGKMARTDLGWINTDNLL